MLAWPLTPVQQELQASARAFAETEIAPLAQECDRQAMLPAGLLERFHATGMPRGFLEGPLADDFVTNACLVAEELSYACAGLTSSLMLPLFFNRVVLAHLPAAEREPYLEACLAAPVVTSFAASEARAGSDMLALEVTAARTPTGYTVNGRKEYSSNLRSAHNVIVVARTREPELRAPDALSWFLVPTDSAGLRIGERWPTFGLRAIDVSPMDLSNVEVPASTCWAAKAAGWP